MPYQQDAMTKKNFDTDLQLNAALDETACGGTVAVIGQEVKNHGPHHVGHYPSAAAGRADYFINLVP